RHRRGRRRPCRARCLPPAADPAHRRAGEGRGHRRQVAAMSHEFPLEGVRVVDMSQGIAGPSAGMMLAQYGADVVKIEPREGDWSRSITAGAIAMTSMAIATNLGKRSIALDLKQPQGAEIVHRLARRADVFIENF